MAYPISTLSTQRPHCIAAALWMTLLVALCGPAQGAVSQVTLGTQPAIVQVAGATVRLTATATTTGTAEFQFWVRAPGSGAT